MIAAVYCQETKTQKNKRPKRTKTKKTQKLRNQTGKPKKRHTHTLDKNGSLYDPAGTESCDMQIRLVSYLDKDEYMYIYI